MRSLVAVGKVTDGETQVIELASACGWCGKPLSEEDAERIARGAVISHGLCPDCRDKHFPEPPRAA